MAKAVAQARVLAAAKAKAQVKKVYDSHWIKLRKTTLYGKEMRSVSALLERVKTAQSRKVRPNVAQRLGPWSRKWRRPPQSFGQDLSGACDAKTGGGRHGYAATYEAMSDIYEWVK